MFGTWKVETIVRLAGRLDARALFTVPIANTGGQLAQVIAIPPYNVIAFADPAEPQSGAPIGISLIVVDAKGDPATGKAVTVTFEGPSAQTPLTAKEDAASLGPGRYKIELAALDAGTWKLTIKIGNEGSGTYSLDVAR